MSTDIAPRSTTPVSALARIVGTGDVAATMAHVEMNARRIVDIARERGFVRRFGESQTEFYGFPAWQLLGVAYGLVPFVEWSRPIQGGYEARAVVRTVDEKVVASAEAMATKQEPNHRRSSDHTLRAMAQVRAQRNALRGALGWALVLAGFDFADPAAPATTEQVGMLHQLERGLGIDHDEGHRRAGVTSYRDLSREEASDLIEDWTQRGAEETEPVRGRPADTPPPRNIEPLEASASGGGLPHAAPEPEEVAPHTPSSGSPSWRRYIEAVDALGGPYKARLLLWPMRREHSWPWPPSPDWDDSRLIPMAETLEAAAADDPGQGP